jgi:hypothetical protein
MAGEDGFVRIGTKIDETGLDEGLGKVDKKLGTATKGTKDFTGGLLKAGVAAAGVAAAVKLATKVVGDLTDAYRTQYKAETQLEAAAKNNPYLDEAAVSRLKSYAGQLQAVAAIGDEQLLPYMASLATAGRTEVQIQEIMQVALDASASGAMSLDSAVRNLNKTYGGLAGELGETVPELRGLTAEQMKNGAAVKLLGERYKGMAAEVATNVGSGDKLKNAFGDLKEVLGAPFERGLAPAREFFATLIQGWADAKKQKDEYDRAAKEALMDQTITAQTFLETWEAKYGKNAKKKAIGILDILTGGLGAAGSDPALVKEVFNAAEEELGLTTDKILALNDAYGIFGASTNKAIESIRKEEEARAAARKATLDSLATARKAQAKKDADDAKLKDQNDKALAHIEKITKAREDAIAKINLQAEAEGREADQQEIINAYVASYVSLIGESEGLITENNGAAKELLATIESMAAEYEIILWAEDWNVEKTEQHKKAVEDLKAALDAITEEVPGSSQMKKQLDALDAMHAGIIFSERITEAERLAIQEEYFKKRKVLIDQIGEAEKEEAAATLADRQEKTLKALEIANTFAAQYQQIMASLQSLVAQQIEDEASVKTAELQKQYEDGAISAEEYEEKLTEVKRNAAKEKYKIDMWAWSANIAAAVSNVALAATKALADGGGWLGAALAAGIIVLGGVQLASLIAAKPIPPTFATGGIVGGTSYTGDKIESLLNSGEMVLNAGQQRNLFDRINSGELGNSPNVQVYNSAANIVKTDATVDDEGIRIAIRQVVSKDMGDGKFNGPFRRMQQNIRGVRYTS